jgi:uncharacterized protein (DUF1330 family)
MTPYVVFQFNTVYVDKISEYAEPALASVTKYGGCYLLESLVSAT